FVVIDTPPKMGLDGRPAVEAADLVLVPMTPSEMDKWATEPTLELIEREKQDSLIVLNRVNPRTNLVQRMRAEIPKMGVKLAKTEINQRVIYADVISSGLSVIEKAPSSEAAKEILALRKEIMRRLKD
ncbi:MAG: ParA family protein, partial [Pseudomonadota bacterium]